MQTSRLLLPALVSVISVLALSGAAYGVPYDPPGNLFDNGQNNGSGESYASQDSATIYTARTADDFILQDPDCASGLFEITSIRGQLQQRQDRIQPVALDLYDDGGSGTSPTSGISPFVTYPELSRTVVGTLGSFDLLELTYDTSGLTLDGGTVYWLSLYGTDAAANTDGFSQFFLPSDGAPGTSANAVGIIPDGIAPTWTPLEDTDLGSSQHYSFAIDGVCAPTPPTAIPTLSAGSLSAFAVLLVLAAGFLLRRRAV